jgi:hypothetical protein
MNLEILPTRISGAAENMATDFLLLQRYPRAVPRFRHYGWRGPAFTFGYSQKIAFVREALAKVEPPFELCRRATGGGIVDHRDDWTFALVIPRGHPLEELRATQSYREVHEALAAALRAQGVAAVTKPCVDEPASDGAGPAPPAYVFNARKFTTSCTSAPVKKSRAPRRSATNTASSFRARSGVRPRAPAVWPWTGIALRRNSSRGSRSRSAVRRSPRRGRISTKTN